MNEYPNRQPQQICRNNIINAIQSYLEWRRLLIGRFVSRGNKEPSHAFECIRSARLYSSFKLLLSKLMVMSLMGSNLHPITHITNATVRIYLTTKGSFSVFIQWFVFEAEMSNTPAACKACSSSTSLSRHQSTQKETYLG